MSNKHNWSLWMSERQTFEGFVMKAQRTLGPREISGEYWINVESDLAKSVKFRAVSFIDAQSELYPKLWMRTCLNAPASSRGSHSLGQKVSEFLCFVHVFWDPPPSPYLLFVSYHLWFRPRFSVVHGRIWNRPRVRRAWKADEALWVLCGRHRQVIPVRCGAHLRWCDERYDGSTIAWNLAVKSLMGEAERGQPTSINPTLIDRLALWEKDQDRTLLRTWEELRSQKPQAKSTTVIGHVTCTPHCGLLITESYGGGFFYDLHLATITWEVCVACFACEGPNPRSISCSCSKVLGIKL